MRRPYSIATVLLGFLISGVLIPGTGRAALLELRVTVTVDAADVGLGLESGDRITVSTVFDFDPARDLSPGQTADVLELPVISGRIRFPDLIVAGDAVGGSSSSENVIAFVNDRLDGEAGGLVDLLALRFTTESNGLLFGFGFAVVDLTASAFDGLDPTKISADGLTQIAPGLTNISVRDGRRLPFFVGLPPSTITRLSLREVPEPAAVGLLGLAFAGLVGARRRGVRRTSIA